MTQRNRYTFVGPANLREVPAADHSVCVRTGADLDRWLMSRDKRDLAEPFTFVVDLDGRLWLASRRSEHVALARGRDVLGAGEIQFREGSGGWVVDEVSNQSTGYCPDPDSWPAVASALDRAGVPCPEHFTNPVTFRRCPACAQRNLVRDEVFVCAVCDGDLPDTWNFDEP